MLFISPPFGNYINLPNSISIKGSFTLEPRGGLFMQILKTLRYSFEHHGWVNKIGLRNKGIDWAIKHHNKNDICSIAILHENDIPIILNKIPKDMNIELNVSCPNAETNMVKSGLQGFLNIDRKWCIIKLSPTCDQSLIDNYYKQGFRQFHCSNTIPIKNGGRSGPLIIPYNIKLIKYLKKQDDIEIIAGGGIRNNGDVQLYKYFGAHHVSISSLCFNPFILCVFYVNYTHLKI
jgi:dihydroorotate dehydrogenase